MEDALSGTHYESADWVDFVRDVAQPELFHGMQRHLADGCAICQDLHDTWRAVLAAARAEPSFEPPPSALRRAGALYRPAQAQRATDRPHAAVATLLFDSYLTAVTGVRSLRHGPRKLLYGKDDFLIDLQIEPARQRRELVLTGQVMEMNTWEPRVTGLKVRLLARLNTIAEMTTNALGEFRLEVREPPDDLDVVIDLLGTALTIPLSDLR
jgi:hypothetical protein